MSRNKGLLIAGALVALVAAASTGTSFAMESDDEPKGKTVCEAQGDVTHEGTEDKIGAFSNEFDEGTLMRVTNTENGKSVTAPVIGPAGSCVLLTLNALKEIQNNENNLVIRQNKVEVVGKAGDEDPAPPQDDEDKNEQKPDEQEQPDADEQVGEVVCEGDQLRSQGFGNDVGFLSKDFEDGSILKATNVKTGKFVTGPVIGTSGSCALLTLGALRGIQENPNNELIREARVELISGQRRQ